MDFSFFKFIEFMVTMKRTILELGQKLRNSAKKPGAIVDMTYFSSASLWYAAISIIFGFLDKILFIEFYVYFSKLRIFDRIVMLLQFK